MMTWDKLGLVFDPRGKFAWAVSHALQPTPLVLGDRIRVFVGLRDAEGVSRIGFVDLDKEVPTRVLGFSSEAVLDIGDDGCFDENGVVPSAIVRVGDQLFLFYAGYQLGRKVRFAVLGGLAVSDNGGRSFKRVKRTPVFERTDAETLFRVPHTVLLQEGVWKAWYGGGSHFQIGSSKTLPVYDIRYTESLTPTDFGQAGRVVLETKGQEYRIGRPFVLSRSNDSHYLFYGYSTEYAPYRIGYAFSNDLENWVRIDEIRGLEPSAKGWDSEMAGYPAVVSLESGIFMLFNGRGYGEDGFGIAKLIQW